MPGCNSDIRGGEVRVLRRSSAKLRISNTMSIHHRLSIISQPPSEYGKVSLFREPLFVGDNLPC